MDSKYEFLAWFDTNRVKINIIKENIIKRDSLYIKELGTGSYSFKKPKNYKEIEKELNGVFIWGDETSDELFNKIISQDNEKFKKAVGLMIFSTSTIHSNEAKGCFELLKNYDENLYNSFGNDVLKPLGLKTTNKWWKF